MRALKYMNSKNLIHLDLKPANIMFTNKDLKEIVLVDFGISNFYKENEKSTIFGMTLAYCPPEIKWDILS